MVDRRVEVVARLKSLEEAAAPLVTFLQNPSAVQELRADKQYNLQMLNDRYQVHCFYLIFSCSFLLSGNCIYDLIVVEFMFWPFLCPYLR